MVPCSAGHEKGNSILRRENKWHLYPYSCQRGVGRENCCRTVAHAVAYNHVTKPWTPFSFVFVFLIIDKYTWVGLHGHSFLLHMFQNFICLKYELKRFENKTILQSPNQIWSKSCPSMWWMWLFSDRQKGCPLAVLWQPACHDVQVRGR